MSGSSLKERGRRLRVVSSVSFAVLALFAVAAPGAGAQTPLPNTLTATGLGQAAVRAPERLSERSIGQAVERANEVATIRAYHAAHARAALLAAVAGLQLGAPVAIEESELNPFLAFEFDDEESYCRERRQVVRRNGRRVSVRRRVCGVPPTMAAGITVTFATSPRPAG